MMNIAQFDNEIRRQCMSIPGLALVQFDNIRKSLETLPEEKLRNLKKIIVTGCGDSYIAAEVAEEVFGRFLKGSGCYAFGKKAIEATRFISLGEGEENMVVAISASGGPARVFEALARGNAHDNLTLALTNKPESRAGKEAKLVLYVGTPEYPDHIPGLRSYFASLLALYMLAAHIGVIKGTAEKNVLDKMRAELAEYNERYLAALPAIDEKAFEVAVRWNQHKAWEVIADGSLYGTAEFIVAKYAECSGDKAVYVDSEDYCHVSTFFYPREAMGTMVVARVDDPNRSRIPETINQAVATGRDILLVADAPKAEFGIVDEVDELVVPKKAGEMPFLSDLYAYIPGSLISGYRAALIDEPYFRGRDIRYFAPELDTISHSKVVIL